MASLILAYGRSGKWFGEREGTNGDFQGMSMHESVVMGRGL